MNTRAFTTSTQTLVTRSTEVSLVMTERVRENHEDADQRVHTGTEVREERGHEDLPLTWCVKHTSRLFSRIKHSSCENTEIYQLLAGEFEQRDDADRDRASIARKFLLESTVRAYSGSEINIISRTNAGRAKIPGRLGR
ncbi:hypothetical protein HAPG_00084 [Halorubrum phage GNf2]|nr:hypothetical protein HAPG_00084 [Halorubrum phage GNf2]